jgi:sialate O-acetylesterase
VRHLGKSIGTDGALSHKLLPQEATASLIFCQEDTELPFSITAGLVDNQVLQRNEDDVAEINLAGVATTEGEVLATLYRQEAPFEEYDACPVGLAEGGTWSAVLTDIPAGGPYVLELTLGEERLRVGGILVGDLWVLAGQSNMEGCGDLIDMESPSPYVHVFDMGHRWHVAEEPLHWLIDSPDSCHSEVTGEEQRKQQIEARKTRTKGTGLGLPFANAMFRETGVPVGLITCAHGGTSMQQWNPELKHLGGGSLYGSMVNHVRLAGGEVTGVLWYQGESDANPDDAPLYTDRMKALVSHIRKDFNAPRLPFYYVQIGRFVTPAEWGHLDSKDWNSIQEQQRLLVDTIPGTGMAPAVDLELDDLIHIGTQGLKRLGERLAALALNGEKGIQLIGVAVEKEDRTRLRVQFKGVCETGLEDSTRVTGFSVLNSEGKTLPTIYKAQVDVENPNDILLELVSPVGEGWTLWYGQGFDPPCTLTDTEDRGLPVFQFPLQN